MQVIRCKNCGNSHVEFGNTSVTVKYTTNIKCCEHCNNIKEEVKTDFFCCVKCYDNYIQECLKK